MSTDRDLVKAGACLGVGFLISFIFPPAFFIAAPKAEVEAEDVVSDKTDKPYDSHNSLGFGAISRMFNRGKKEEGPSHSGSEQERPHKSTEGKNSKP